MHKLHNFNADKAHLHCVYIAIFLHSIRVVKFAPKLDKKIDKPTIKTTKNYGRIGINKKQEE